MWQIYDDLIAGVPPDLRVSECLIGLHWTLIRSRLTGMALTPFDTNRAYGKQGGSIIAGIGGRIAGMPLRKLAEYVKSWNPYEATLGLAAVNSAFNSQEQVEKLSGSRLSNQPQVSAFVHYADLAREKGGCGRPLP